MTRKLDQKDLKIMAFLNFNAKMPMRELGKQLGLSTRGATYRVQNLEEQGILNTPKAVVDAVLCGREQFHLYFVLHNTRTEEKEKFINIVKGIPGISWIAELRGSIDFQILIFARDRFHINQKLATILKSCKENVASYIVTFDVAWVILNPAFFIPEEERERTIIRYSNRRDPSITLDAVDRKILNILSLDAGTPTSIVAQAAGLSIPTLTSRVRRLEELGVILGYRYYLDPKVIGYKSFHVSMKVHQRNYEQEQQLIQMLEKMPNIVYIMVELGKTMPISIRVDILDQQELQNILSLIREQFHELVQGFAISQFVQHHYTCDFPEEE
jgi:Lrp/AsnC family transcriptional regulator, regulator for asnA, asnC and gidA